MNDKIAKTMLGLCIGYLSVFYVLKFFFPELLIQVIASPTLIRLGEVMKNYPLFDFAMQFISSFIVLYLFCCSSTGRFKFTLKEFGVIIGGNIICFLCSIFLSPFYTHTTTAMMLLLATYCKGKLAYSAIAFALHGYLSMLLSSIKGFETIIIYINSISGFMLAFEGYLWLVLLSIIFYFKENKRNELASPLHQQAS